MLYFEDYLPGREMEADATYRVSEAEIVEMGERWDPQPFHVDAAAATDSIFGGLVCCSAHLFAIFTWFSHHFSEPAAAVSALGFRNVRMLHPVRPGDELRCVAATRKARVSKSRPDCGVVESEGRLVNQDGIVVLTIDNAFLMRRRSR